MDRHRAMLWAILAGSVLFTTYTLRPTGGAVTAAAPAIAAAPQTVAVAATAPAQPPAEPLSEEAWIEWRGRLGGPQRDPFFTEAELAALDAPRPVPRAASAPDVPPANYTLKLVIATGSEHRALVGDRVVKVGDMLGDERVAEILPDRVVLERRGERRRLDLASGASTAGAIIQLERIR